MNTTLKSILTGVAVVVAAAGFFLAGRFHDRWDFARSLGSGWIPMSAVRGAGPDWDGMDVRHGWMMGNGGGPMMGWGNGYGSDVTNPVSIEDARQSAQRYLEALKVDSLMVDEIMIFDNHAYVVIREEGTGLGAFELLVDPDTRTAYPEPGPNMMWNLKYGGLHHGKMMGASGMGGMMSGGSLPEIVLADVAAEMPLSEDRAVDAAQSYLDRYLPGATVAGHATMFYGYYTLDYVRDEQVAGMLSVNGFSAQVFPHHWHGTFIEESE